MRIAVVVVLGVVVGCASTPADILETGEKFTTEHSTPPEKTAACIVNHVDATSVGMLARAQPSTVLPGGQRIIVRALGEAPTTVAVIDALPNGNASKLTWHLHRWESVLGTVETVMGQIRGAC